MMAESYYEPPLRMRDIDVHITPPNLRTGIGHGHARAFDRERPKRDAWAKRRKRAKIRKASHKRNRR